MMINDYYKLLNVDYTASNQEITRAYKKKLLVHHPDINHSQNNTITHEIIEAYKILTDSEERFQYNLKLIKFYQKENKKGLGYFLASLFKRK